MNQVVLMDRFCVPWSGEMKIENTLSIYVLDDKETPICEPPEMKVLSESLYSSRVTIMVGGHTYSVIADELIKAIRNAINQ